MQRFKKAAVVTFLVTASVIAFSLAALASAVWGS
jgi:predicted benzoate:H+ symporter BenE